MKTSKRVRKMTRLNEYVISHAYGLPQEQDVIGQSTVAASGFDVEKGKWFIILNGTVQKQDIAKSVKSVIGKSKYFSTQGRVYEVTTDSKYNTEVVKSNPPGQVQTVVSGGVTSQRVRKNPVSVSDFRSEMDGMLVSDPRRDFKVIDAPTPFGGESFRDVLFSFVSYRGESYGWTKGNKIYHRRGSLIMPKLKVNRAVEGAKMFYHTHPSKDEPSLSSADDYQFYFDLAFAFGIKHFYTIMENRLDHFEITVKKSKEEDYLKMDEDKVLDDINSIIDASEAEITKKHKSDKNLPDEKFYAKMTKDTVTRLNRRFGDFATIKYKGHANPKIVRENPSDAGFRHNPPIRISHIHKASQLEELRDTTNNFEHYGANEYGHSQYVYWWVDHHFSSTNIHPQGRLYKLKELGLDDDNRRLLRAYMEEEVAPGYSKLDILLLLALYHDVGKKREKEQGIHHSIIASNMFQDEIGPELNLPKEVSDVCALLMLTDCGRKNITPEAFKAQAGDYLGVAYALQIADMLAHHPFMFTSLASEAKQEGRLDKANVEQYKVMVAKELFGKIADFLQTRVKTNPPPVAKSIIYAGSYDTPIDGDIAEQYLEVKKKHNGQLFIPIEESDATVTLGLSSGSFRTTMSRAKGHFTEEDPFGADLAVSLYEQIGRVLSDFTPGLSFAEAPEPAVMVNPRHAKKIHVVTVAGPTVTGKQAVIEEVARMTGGVVVPTVTTRPKRKHEAKSTDRIFVSDSKFKEMIEQGEFVEWNKAKNGYMFGRRFSDFTKPVAVVDVNLRNVSKYQDAFPNTTSVFLDPDMTPAKLATKLRSEVAVTKEQAATKAKQINKQVADAQHIPFDMVIKSQGDKPHATAKQISDDIERHNPPASHYLNEVDRHYIEYVKSNMRQVSPVVLNRIERNGKITDRYMVVFEFPVVEKQDRKVKKVGTIRALFYSRSGTGSERQGREYAEALFNLTDYTFDRRAEDGTRRMTKYDVLAEAPFLHNIAWKKWGDARGRDFSPVMWLSMLGYQRDPSWYIKPGYSQFFNFLNLDEPRTTPPFPSRQNEEKFQHRWGHRSMFYAGVALSELIPEPASLWKGQFLPREEINSFMRKHGAIIRNDVKDNPKSREEWFMDWAKLINMKNKELEAFLDSPLGKKAGLSASEAKEQGIHSGRVSGRAILRMRKKIGLGGPKDYIKGPVHAKAVFQKAKRKWNDNDWEWCARQVRFNKRFMGDWMGKRKGPLVRKGQPTRRLLALWVWGFDPWRYARKVEKRKTMPKCPKVPWIGRTEKRMYGVQSEEVKMNPPWSLESQENPYIMLKEPWSTFEVPIDERLAPLVLHLWQNNVPTSYSDQGITRQGYLVIRWPYDYAEPIVKKMLKEKIIFVGHKKVWKGGDRAFPENSITIRWEKGASTLRKIYESFGLKYPTSRKKAEEMVEAMLAKENPQDKLPWLPEPAVAPATIEPHLDWPQFTKPAWLPKSMIPKTAVFSPSRATTIRGVRMVKPAFYYIPPADLNALINSQKYLELQEADRQRKIAEAEALKKQLQEQGQTFVGDWKENPPHIFKKGDIIYYNNDTPKTWQGRRGRPDTLIEKYDSFRVWEVNDMVMHSSGTTLGASYGLMPIKAFNVKTKITLGQKFVEENFIKEPDMTSSMLPDYLVNPPNIPFPIPEEYQEELERRLTEEMTSEGYKPHTIPEVIEEGLYDDSPSDFAYAQGEYEEFLEEIEKGDFDEAYAEYSDVEGHVAYWLWTNHRIQVPIYTGTHVDKTRVRIQIFNHLFNQYGLKFGPKYLKGGSNYEKVHKVRKALDAAADDQGKPRSKDTDEEMAKKVATSVAAIVKKNPPTVIATGAPHKIAEYEKHLGDGYSFNDTYDLPEVEAGPKTVAIHKAKLAYEVMGGPVLVEDTTLHIRGMSSKDASKIKWLVKNLDKHIGKRAIERVYIGYCDGEKVYLYLGQTKGTLLSPRGDKGFGYDLYFSPDGSDKTYAEEKFVSSRTKAIKKMLSDKPDYVGPMPADWKGEWQAGYSPADGINENPPNSLEEDFEWMIDNAYENLTKKIQGEDPDYDGQMWWNEQKPWIREKYGMAPVEGARWLTPIYEEDFDPDSKEGEFIDNELTGKEDATPLHFLNQLKRIPLQREPNALRILQVALNIGQGLAANAIEERYSIEDFVAYDNPRTPGGKKFPSKYLKGLNALEKMIAEDEIDKGYKYDADDPKAYEFWKSDIKATARGLKIGTSKHRVKYYKKYRKNIDKDYKPAGNSPKQKFLNRIRKETKIKKSILEKIYDKGLAAWRVGHRPGVQQHQWAAGRVYAFAVGADSSTGPGKPDHKLAVEAGVR